MKLTPFFKWVGGKKRISDQIIPILDVESMPFGSTYYEPMIGGGAIFWEVVGNIHRACIGDINPHIVNAYRQVYEFPGMVAVNYNLLRNEYEDFYKFRDYVNTIEIPSTPEHAAAFILFTKRSFNGLWRVNKSGVINSPSNKANVRDVKAHEFEKHCTALESMIVDIKQGSVFDFNIDPKPGDRIFLDPPYLGQFRMYDSTGFSEDDHEKLRELAVTWAEKGARVILMGSDTDDTRSVYGEPDMYVRIKRTVAAKPEKRKSLNEVMYIYDEHT